VTLSEDALLALLKKLYWENGSQNRCNQPQALRGAWSGKSQELEAALQGLDALGYFDPRTSPLSAYCLSQAGLQAIGAIP
jgi:hypothetical protein